MCKGSEAGMKTKGEVEAEICKAMIRFEVDYMGRGPEECRARIVEDMLLIRLTGGSHPGGTAADQDPGWGGINQEDTLFSH